MTKLIHLEDHGQDFLRFHLTDSGHIADANLQGEIWNGKTVVNAAKLRAGNLLEFPDGRKLRYPVETITT